MLTSMIARGKYTSASAYIRALIRKEARDKAQRELEQELLKGMRSGPAQPMTRKGWDKLRQIVSDARKKAE